MTREDLARFRALEIDFDSIGLLQDGAEDFAYFCTPIGAEYVGRIGCDGVHFILLPEDERVFCVDPAMGKEGKYVLPVGGDFREFLSFILYAKNANPLSQIWWMDEAKFRQLLAEDAAQSWPGCEEYFAQNEAALTVIAQAFGLTAADPFQKVKAMQAAFDPSGLNWSDEYYDVLGLENPRHPGEEERIQGTHTVICMAIREDSMIPKDPNILLSYVNTKLRDEYSSVEALCDGLDASELELTKALAGIGYAYDPQTNQFKPV